jgi:hypothetical protein
VWQRFLTLPLVARAISVAVVSLLALWAALKAKAVKKTAETAIDWFWGWLGKKIAAGQLKHDDTYRKTYKGKFEDYWFTSNPTPTHLFRITHDGISTTVPVWDTPLFADLKRGDLVEIDTNPSTGAGELVKRVRVLKRS